MKNLKTPTDLDAAGLRYWRTVTRVWTLDSHQNEILRQACKCLDVIAANEAQMATVGPLVQDRFGQWKQNPAVLTIRDYRGLFQRLVRELGLADDASDSRPPALRNRYRGRS
jgi:phage terminase small subunit